MQGSLLSLSWYPIIAISTFNHGEHLHLLTLLKSLDWVGILRPPLAMLCSWEAGSGRVCGSWYVQQQGFLAESDDG